MPQKIVFIIGPSGVGKSSHARRYADEHTCVLIDTDSSLKKREGSAQAYLSSYGRQRFFQRTAECVKEDLAAAGEANVLVVVGAGQLEYADADYEAVRRWLRAAPRLTIIDDPSLIVPRLGARPTDGFEAREFSQTRKRLYGLGDATVDVAGRTEDKVYPDVSEALDALFNDR